MSCLIKLFIRSRGSQSHTNNGLFKLVEALLQIYSCFFKFSHSIKLQYTWLTAISSVAVSLHYRMSVFNIQTQGSQSVISNKPRKHTEKT